MRRKKFILKLIKQKYSVGNLKIPPLSLLTLATLTPKQLFDVEIIDGNMEKIKATKADLVGITTCTIEAIQAYKIADSYHKHGAKVILGGIHPSFLPHEAIKHADSVVIGEAEDIWPTVLDDFSKGKLKQFYHQQHFPDLSKPRVADYGLLKHKYLFSAIQTTRGCPYNCEFCSVIAYNGREQRHKPVEDVVTQIKNIKDVRQRKKEMIFIVDDNLTSDKEYAKKLFRAMIPLKVRWFAQLSANFADDEELLRLAHKSGLRVAVIGFESVNQDSLNSVRKINIVKKYGQLLDKLRRYKIIVLGLFILGLDSDTKKTFKQTLNFCRLYKIPFAFFQSLRPLPGTPLFERMKKERRIITTDWSKYDKVVLKPKLMSVYELERGNLWLYRKFYSVENIARNLSSLLKFNYSFRYYLIMLWFYAFLYFEWKWKSVMYWLGR